MNRSLLHVFIVLASSSFTLAQSYPDRFEQVKVVDGISRPTVMAFAPDGRIFIAEQGGNVKVVKDGSLLPVPFAALTVKDDHERGLLGLTFDPDFITNNYIYLYYTVPGVPAHNRVSRFTAYGDVVVPGSETILLDLNDLSTAPSANDNGGALSFGPDGKLYIAVGENTIIANSQDLDNYLGKILRINKDGTVPEGNPFTEGSESKKRIWQYGLRNPFNLSFQASTGKFFINDVGKRSQEEINDGTIAGKNFGWPNIEGFDNDNDDTGFTNPVYAYGHGSADGVGCAITGGTFFNPSSSNYPTNYIGKYFFLDFCGNWINYIDFSGTNAVNFSFATSIAGNALSLMTGPDGNLYFLSRGEGAVYKIVYDNSSAPAIVQQPTGRTVSKGSSASFSVTSIGSAPLTHQWQHDGANVGANASILTLTNVQFSDAGRYKVTISNSVNELTSDEVLLTVVEDTSPVENTLPVATIIEPLSTDKYDAGTNIAYSASATDAEDGQLDATAFSWQIDFHHDIHKDDQSAVVGKKSGVFIIPDEGETSSNVWYRFILTVSDKLGAVAKDSVDLYPNKSALSFSTSPSGLQITLDGQPLLTPASVVSVVGMKRELGVVTPQTIDNTDYQFVSWEQSGNATQIIATPSAGTAYMANFQRVVIPVIVGLGDPFTTTNGIFIYPSPASEENVTLLINANNYQYTTIRCVDMHSGTVREWDVNLNAGENKVTLAVNNLKQGLYHVSVFLDGQRKGTKMMIAR